MTLVGSSSANACLVSSTFATKSSSVEIGASIFSGSLTTALILPLVAIGFVSVSSSATLNRGVGSV